MDFTNTEALNSLLSFFEQHSIVGMIALKPYANQLIYGLGIIDLCTTWSIYSGEEKFTFFINKVIKIAFFIFLLLHWNQLNKLILQGFQYAGMIAANVSVTSSLYNPSGILNQGFNVVTKLLHDFHNTSIMSGGGLAKCLMDLIAVIITLGAFFFMALQILITKIEFSIFASLGIILMPFGALRFTSFLFQRVLSTVFSYGIKLMVMYFILGLFVSLLPSVTAISPTSDFSIILKTCSSYAVLGIITWLIPNKAASMFNGTPTLDGGQVMGTAKNAAMGAAAIASGGTSAVAGMAGKAASTYGNAKATVQAARASQATNGGSMAKNLASTMAKQRFANSSVGKGLIRGANNAMNHSDDYSNIKSGDYYKKPQDNRN